MCIYVRMNIGGKMNTSVQLRKLISETLSSENSVINKMMPEPVRRLMKRRRLWELNERNHCPVIGVCLSIDELVRFARRFGFTASLQDHYALHVEAANRSNTRNVVSRAMQKHLDMKYRQQIVTFNQAKTDTEVRELWEQYFTGGDVAGAMWASLTHKATSERTQEIIYANVHMHSHQTGAGQAADIRRLNQLEKENAEYRATVGHQQQQQTQTEARLREKLNNVTNELENLRQTQTEMTALQERIRTLESGEAMVEMGRRLMDLTTANEQLRAVAMRVSILEESLKAACNGGTTLVKERNSLVAERNMLEGLLMAKVNEEQPYDQLQTLGKFSMQESCVLCVGGRTALLPQYRMLAKQQGICLIHHDGGQEEALSRLPDLIGRATAVICPTDCVSHAAYYQLKRHCKLINKPCLLFKGASVTSFAKALTQLSCDEVNQSRNVIRTIPAVTKN